MNSLNYWEGVTRSNSATFDWVNYGEGPIYLKKTKTFDMIFKYKIYEKLLENNKLAYSING